MINSASAADTFGRVGIVYQCPWVTNGQVGMDFLCPRVTNNGQAGINHQGGLG